METIGMLMGILLDQGGADPYYSILWGCGRRDFGNRDLGLRVADGTRPDRGRATRGSQARQAFIE